MKINYNKDKYVINVNILKDNNNEIDKMMNGSNTNINNINSGPVTITIGISCNVFDSYQNIPLRLSQSFINEVLSMNSTEGMKALSRHICTHAISIIYEDLAARNDQAKIRQLIQKVQLFHIHGRTARDIIYPSNCDDAHAHHGRLVYVCTHC
jgi:hypothetical protein